MLDVENIQVFYGKIHALKGISISVEKGEIVALGVAQAPEGRKIFNRLTVTENLEMGAYLRSDGTIGEDIERAFALFPRLK